MTASAKHLSKALGHSSAPSAVLDAGRSTLESVGRAGSPGIPRESQF